MLNNFAISNIQNFIKLTKPFKVSLCKFANSALTIIFFLHVKQYVSKKLKLEKKR